MHRSMVKTLEWGICKITLFDVWHTSISYYWPSDSNIFLINI